MGEYIFIAIQFLAVLSVALLRTGLWLNQSFGKPPPGRLIFVETEHKSPTLLDSEEDKAPDTLRSAEIKEHTIF